MASVDVGDPIDVTFTTTTGATVTVTWIDPTGVTVVTQAVAEQPAGSGKFPARFVSTSAGVWEARFTATGAATAIERYYARVVPLTGPPPLATVGEVQAQFGSMTPEQEALTGTLLRAASRRVRARFLMLDKQIANSLVDAEVAALGIVAMVLRVLRNPQGLKSETVGPFSRAYDTSVAAGLLVIGPDDAILFAPNPWRFPKAKTIIARAGLDYYPRGIHPEIRHQYPDSRWRNVPGYGDNVEPFMDYPLPPPPGS